MNDVSRRADEEEQEIMGENWREVCQRSTAITQLNQNQNQNQELQEWGISWMNTDLVHHPHINLQDVGDTHGGSGWCWESQTEVVNYDLHQPWENGRHLGKKGWKKKRTYLYIYALDLCPLS